jgi:hypothetical protein
MSTHQAQVDAARGALPGITDEDRQFLHYNPNTNDLVEWIQNYALAAIAAESSPWDFKYNKTSPAPAASDYDTLVERSAGAMAIAEGEEGWENVPLSCPMLAEVAKLRKAYDALRTAPAASAPYKHIDDSTEDPALLWAEIHHLRVALQGPAGYATWQDAATDERIRRVKAERAAPAAGEPPPDLRPDWFASRPVKAPAASEPVAWVYERNGAKLLVKSLQRAKQDYPEISAEKWTALYAQPPAASSDEQDARQVAMLDPDSDDAQGLAAPPGWWQGHNRAMEHLGPMIQAKQARIDALMLEYCPDEMTPEQIAEWEKHQVISPDSAAIDAALKGEPHGR